MSDLAGKSICFYQGDNAHLTLEASMAARRLDFVRMAYMEYGELHDAYNAGVCDAQVGESGDLAAARLEEHGAPASRILAEPLGYFPGVRLEPGERPAMVGDPRLGDLRPATRRTAGDRLGRRQALSPWPSRGAISASPKIGPNAWSAPPAPMPTSMPAISAKGSPLKLPRGPNAPSELGGLFVTPYRE